MYHLARSAINLTDHQRNIIVGTVLGDGSLIETASKNNFCLQIDHCNAQKEYVFWKYEALDLLVPTPPKYQSKNKSWRFRTISHPELTEIGKLFYRNRIKVVPKEIASLLTPLGLAVWFMDDGNAVIRRGKLCGYNLNTQSFAKEENELLAEVFSALYNISCIVEKNHGYYRLAIWQAASRRKFSDLIQEHILPSMKYKISSIGDSSSPVETGVLQLAEQR